MKISVITSLINKENVESVDITGPVALQVQISAHGDVLWINDVGAGKCLVRICKIQPGLLLNDDRLIT